MQNLRNVIDQNIVVSKHLGAETCWCRNVQSCFVMADEPDSKKRKSELVPVAGNSDVFSSFADFEFCNLLKNDMGSKTAFVHSKFRGKDAVILMEKTAFDPESLPKLLTEKTELMETLKNDIYSTYKTYPEKELNGMNPLRPLVNVFNIDIYHIIYIPPPKKNNFKEMHIGLVHKK